MSESCAEREVLATWDIDDMIEGLRSAADSPKDQVAITRQRLVEAADVIEALAALRRTAQGEPTDAQVTAAKEALGHSGSGVTPLMMRRALRAAAAIQEGENDGTGNHKGERMGCILCRLSTPNNGTSEGVLVVFGLSVCSEHAEPLVDMLIDGASVREILRGAKAGEW